MSIEESIMERINEDCLKTCGRCKHDMDQNISGSACYHCIRNPFDKRTDNWEQKEDK